MKDYLIEYSYIIPLVPINGIPNKSDPRVGLLLVRGNNYKEAEEKVKHIYSHAPELKIINKTIE